MQDFRETKIKVLSEEHSRAFQEAVIAAGGMWHEDGEFHHAHERHYLYVNKDLVLEWGISTSFFESHKYREIVFPLPVTAKNVRKDFDPAKEYSVDALESTVEEKGEVQQTFFDVGIACKPEQQGHVHAELMAQYAEDAKTSKTPWEFWEYLDKHDGWTTFKGSPGWYETSEYQRKPKTKLIHGMEIPVFEFTPEVGENFYVANVGLPELFEVGRKLTEGCTFTQRMIERGLIYPYTEEGKQAAIRHAKAMLGMEQG